MLRGSATLAGSAFLAQLFPGSLLRASVLRHAQQAPAPTADPAAAARARMGAAPIQAQKLADNLTLLSGPGGNVVVLNGPDGKFVVDTFVSPAWPKLKDALDGLGNAPLKFVIDTTGTSDHTDNNAPLPPVPPSCPKTPKAHVRPTGHSHSQHTFPASPADALPQQTFAASHKLQANGETLALQHFAPAHTDTDIYIHFERANVIHLGDTFFNGFYPFIDAGTGGKLNGMIAAADKILPLANNDTKIVPGHGPSAIKRPHKVPRHARHSARSRSKIEVRGKIR
jgi:glyoxylase-like metal-dependent hydrolase (beta-lactamase superfamily II)